MQTLIAGSVMFPEGFDEKKLQISIQRRHELVPITELYTVNAMGAAKAGWRWGWKNIKENSHAVAIEMPKTVKEHAAAIKKVLDEKNIKRVILFYATGAKVEDKITPALVNELMKRKIHFEVVMVK